MEIGIHVSGFHIPENANTGITIIYRYIYNIIFLLESLIIIKNTSLAKKMTKFSEAYAKVYLYLLILSV